MLLCISGKIIGNIVHGKSKYQHCQKQGKQKKPYNFVNTIDYSFHFCGRYSKICFCLFFHFSNMLTLLYFVVVQQFASPEIKIVKQQYFITIKFLFI